MNSKSWTAIIPAAGRGTRFSKFKNKIFFHYKKKSILEHLIFKISKLTEKIIIIINKKDLKEAKKILKKFNKKNKIIFSFQNKPEGMASAIEIGLRRTYSKYFYTIWCDQIGISTRTIKKTIIFHEKNNYISTFPITYLKRSYTLVKKDRSHFLIKVYQSRENEFKNKEGYNDCGFFCCNTNFFKKNLKKLIKSKKILTKKTKEHDFLHALNVFANTKKIMTLISKNKYDAVGINFKKDFNKLK